MACCSLSHSISVLVQQSLCVVHPACSLTVCLLTDSIKRLSFGVLQMGMDGVFVGSGIFKSGDAAKRARAIVQVNLHS